jgi:hypothetical protein
MFWPAGTDMEQINTFSLYMLGKWLDSIFLTARGPDPIWWTG